MSGLARKTWGWLASQSDEVQSAICIGATSCLLPLLPTLSPPLLAATNLVAMSTQLGSQVYVAFVGGPTMFLHLPLITFGDIQARLFPKYGMLGMSTGILALGSYYLGHNSTVDTATMLLVTSTLVHMANSFLIFPFVTNKMMEKRRHGEGSEARRRADKIFGISHGVSNLVNLAGLAANLAYFYILAHRIGGCW